jgi:hypothetical protein
MGLFEDFVAAKVALAKAKGQELDIELEFEIGGEWEDMADEGITPAQLNEITRRVEEARS